MTSYVGLDYPLHIGILYSHMHWKLNRIDIDVQFQVDSESCQTSKIKVFVKKVHGFKPLTIYAKSFILTR